jgi:FKBP-type peptidyl-prolyl cis-trans isomerase FklB
VTQEARRSILIGWPAAAALLLTLAPGSGLAAQEPAPELTAKAIQLSFKRDPRVVDPYRGIGPWVTGSSFQGAAAQDAVEIRAEGVSAAGKPTKINPEWTVSDSDMLTVSPSRGDDVKVTVHREGEGRLKVTYQGLSKELVINARYESKFLQFEIVPPKSSANSPARGSAELKSEKEQVSYAAGMRLAKTLRAQSLEVDADFVRRGIEDVSAGGPVLMTDDQADTALIGIATQLNVTEAILARRALAEKNRRQSERFLAANRHKKGVVTLPSGLQYRIIKAGEGAKPTPLDVVFCQYRGTLIDGTEFDNSSRRKSTAPVRFQPGGVIKGWQEALQRMPAGSTWQLFVPPELAYGERGMPRANIPPNAALIFEVELLAVNEPPVLSSPADKTALVPGVSGAPQTRTNTETGQ